MSKINVNRRKCGSCKNNNKYEYLLATFLQHPTIGRGWTGSQNSFCLSVSLSVHLSICLSVFLSREVAWWGQSIERSFLLVCWEQTQPRRCGWLEVLNSVMMSWWHLTSSIPKTKTFLIPPDLLEVLNSAPMKPV